MTLAPQWSKDAVELGLELQLMIAYFHPEPVPHEVLRQFAERLEKIKGVPK